MGLEGSAETDRVCAFHMDPHGRGYEGRAARMAALAERLFSEVSNEPLVLRHVQFPSDFRFPHSILRPVELHSCRFPRAEILNEVRESHDITITQGGADQGLLLTSLRVNGGLAIQSLSGNNPIVLESVTVADSLVIGGATDTARIVFKDVGAGDSLRFEMQGSGALEIEIDGLKCRSIRFGRREITSLVVKNLEAKAVHLHSATVKSLLQLQGKADVLLANGLVSYGRVSFQDLEIARDTDLSNAQLHEGAEFEGCLFHGVFDISTYHDERGTLSHVKFVDCEMKGFALIKRREFTGWMDFSGVTFWQAPEFHGCLLYQDTRFPEEGNFRDTTSKHASSAYRTLKQFAEEMRARRQEGMFFALEQRSARRTKEITSRIERATSWLYDFLTLYGQSYLRPLVALLILVAAFTALFWAWDSGWYINPKAPIDVDSLWGAFVFSVENTVSPLGIWRKTSDELVFLSHASWSVTRLVATLQAVFSVAFLALFLLALRWRFKRD